MAAERPNVVVAALVRSGLIRAPERYRSWLAGELSSGAARRRTAVASLLPVGLGMYPLWLLIDVLDDDGVMPPAWVPVAALVPFLLLSGTLGYGYRRHAGQLRSRNHLD